MILPIGQRICGRHLPVFPFGDNHYPCTFPVRRFNYFDGVAMGLAVFVGDTGLRGQNDTSCAPSRFQVGIGNTKHGRSRRERPDFRTAAEFQHRVRYGTHTNSFMANWQSVTAAMSYLLDISTSDSFDSYVDGYHHLQASDVIGRIVTGLKRGTRLSINAQKRK